jgi:superfamily I DNA and/or RNA helicase
VILNLGVRDLVLVGDHKQLQPYTDVHVTTTAGATHIRSLMQRVAEVSL